MTAQIFLNICLACPQHFWERHPNRYCLRTDDSGFHLLARLIDDLDLGCIQGRFTSLYQRCFIQRKSIWLSQLNRSKRFV